MCVLSGQYRQRGFLLGATAGRATLSGEGLQHQDGSSHVVAATIPNCRAYDPAYAYELAIIMEHGIRRMIEEQADEFFYITVMNENYAQPNMPAGSEQGILKGLYRIGRRGNDAGQARARLIGSGAILPQALTAGDILAEQFGIASDIFSATSYPELARDARAVERANRLGGAMTPARSYVETLLPGPMPIIAASDYVRALPQMIAPYVQGRLVALGIPPRPRTRCPHIRPSPRRLENPSRVIITWSWTAIPSRLQPSATCLVMSISARDGVASPDG
jgi:pyruvate dehydrogenase E1 component